LSRLQVLIAMNEFSLRKFAPQVAPGGTILHGRGRLPDDFNSRQAQVLCIPASEIADKLGSPKVADIVIIGALLEQTECLSPATALNVLEAKVKVPPCLNLMAKLWKPGASASTTPSPSAQSPKPTALPSDRDLT
jgi:2-oxoisovalerate ferredoxin oxidoreductase beta subunit